MDTSNKQEWYRDLDISSKGKPIGIDKIDTMLDEGVCYCIVTQDGSVERVDVYENGRKIHYKKFVYDKLGRVIENAMYSPDNGGEWRIFDDIWYYEYDPKTGDRSKKIMKMPGSSSATEILYDTSGKRISERTITV